MTRTFARLLARDLSSSQFELLLEEQPTTLKIVKLKNKILIFNIYPTFTDIEDPEDLPFAVSAVKLIT